MHSGKQHSPPQHAGKKKQRRTGPLSFHIGKITQGISDLRALDDTAPKGFGMLDDAALSHIMSMGTVVEAEEAKDKRVRSWSLPRIRRFLGFLGLGLAKCSL